jgi:type IV secretory pathway VirB2 component (pilin)
MKKYSAYIFIAIILTGIFSHASVARAAYQLLSPLPGISSVDPTQTTALGTYLNAMIQVFIGICAVLAVVMIVLGGLEYMTSELPGNKEHGKERITGAVFGLVLALGAYALLFTINPDLLKTDFVIPDATVTVAVNDNVPQTPVNGKFGVYTSGANFAAAFPQNSLAALPSGVTVCASNGQCGSGAQCATIGQSNCTSTLGLDSSVVNSIEEGCACQLKITAGTEFWLHGGATGNTSHKPGSATVDLSATPGLTEYITGSSAFPNDGKLYQNGNVCYLAERAGQTSSTTGSHWHVYKC